MNLDWIDSTINGIEKYLVNVLTCNLKKYYGLGTYNFGYERCARLSFEASLMDP